MRKTGFYYRMERTQAQFYRQFTLPVNVDIKNIRARSKKGVLKIILPKKENLI